MLPLSRGLAHKVAGGSQGLNHLAPIDPGPPEAGKGQPPHVLCPLWEELESIQECRLPVHWRLWPWDQCACR